MGTRGRVHTVEWRTDGQGKGNMRERQGVKDLVSEGRGCKGVNSLSKVSGVTMSPKLMQEQSTKS